MSTTDGSSCPTVEWPHPPGVNRPSWRDPWAWRAPDGSIHLLITALARHGPADGRGVIGHASSTDGKAFRVGPPLSEPGEFNQLEGRAPLGPFVAPPGPFLLGDPADHAYAGRIVDLGGRWWLLAWIDQVDGEFVGELADPLPVEVGPDGRLRLSVRD